MLKTRILTAAVLIPAVLAGLFLLPPRAWGVATLAIIAIAAYEWARLVGFAATRWAWMVGGTLIVGVVLLFSPAAGFERGWPDAIVLVAYLVFFSVVMFFAPMLGHLLSPMVLSLTRRLMGLILASIAMEMIVASLAKLFPGWTH